MLPQFILASVKPQYHDILAFIAQVGYDLPALAEAYDWFNVMDYDYHGAWENFTGEAVVMMTSQGTTPSCNVLDCTGLYCAVL